MNVEDEVIKEQSSDGNHNVWPLGGRPLGLVALGPAEIILYRQCTSLKQVLMGKRD